MSRHAKAGTGASAGAGSSSEELAAVEAKLAQFKQLYSNYRKDENSHSRSLLASQAVGASPAAAGAAAAGSRAQADALPVKSALKGSKAQRSSSTGKQRPQSPTAKAAAGHIRAAAAGSPGQKPLPMSNGTGLVGPDQLTTVQKLLTELDVKDLTLANLQGQLSNLQAQLHLQEAHEDELRADYQRQVNQLQEKLGAATEQLNRLEAERWEVLEAVSTVAAGSSALDREQRELERTRLALVDREREVKAREAVAAANIQASIAPERLVLEDLSLLATHYSELNAALDRTDAAVRRRVLLLAGHNPLADEEGGEDSSSALVVAGKRRAAAVDMSHEPCLGYLQVVREGLTAANSYVGAHAGAERHSSAVLAAPIVRHLQQQAAGLSRALVLLASEAEADAARLALLEAQSRERDGQLADALADVRRLTAEAALAAQAAGLAQQLREQRQENEALQTRLRSMRKKLKVAFEEVTAQNRELREKLAAAQAAREDDGSRVSGQLQRLQDDVATARRQLQAHQKREAKLATELAEARQLAAAAVERGEVLQRDLEAALNRAERAEARVAELEAESRGQRALALRVAKEHEMQLVELRAEVQEQLETVVQSYSEELSALQQQLERVEAQQAATAAGLRAPGAAAAGNVSGAAATAAGAASAGRAEAWRMAYEEVREVAHTLKDQLDSAEAENSRLQAQLQRMTTVAVATAAATAGITPRKKGTAAMGASPTVAARGPAAAPAPASPAPPAAASPLSQPAPAVLAPTAAEQQAPVPSKLIQVQPVQPPEALQQQAAEVGASRAASRTHSAAAARPATAAAQAAALAAATAVVVRGTDACSETERLLTRQKSAQTDAPPQEPRATTPPASPPPTVATLQPIPTSQLVIVVRQEPAPRSSHHNHHHRSSRGRSRSRSPSCASSASSPPQQPRSRGRTATATAATATMDTPSRSVGVGDANVRAPQTEDVGVEAAIRSGAGSVSTPSDQRSDGDGEGFGRGTHHESPEPEYYDGEDGEGEQEELEEEEEEGGVVTDVDLDKKGLALHVAALQEQLAALTHQNSVITSQVIEMRQEQERWSSRRSSPARTGGYGSVTGPYGTPSYARDAVQPQPEFEAHGDQEAEQQRQHAPSQRPQPQAASGRSSLPRMASPASGAAQSHAALSRLTAQPPQQHAGEARAPTPSGPAQSAASARSTPLPRPPPPAPSQPQQRHHRTGDHDWHEAEAMYGEEDLGLEGEEEEEREDDVRAVEQLPDPSHGSISLGAARTNAAGAGAAAVASSAGTHTAAAAQVRAELDILRAQYAELQSRYQRQSLRQQELHDALLNVASGEGEGEGWEEDADQDDV